MQCSYLESHCYLYSKFLLITAFLGENSKLGKHVVVQFIKQYNVTMRVKQRNKKNPREAFRENLQKWHLTLWKRLLRQGFHDNYHPKWRRLIPKPRVDVDQSP